MVGLAFMQKATRIQKEYWLTKRINKIFGGLHVKTNLFNMQTNNIIGKPAT